MYENLLVMYTRTYVPTHTAWPDHVVAVAPGAGYRAENIQSNTQAGHVLTVSVGLLYIYIYLFNFGSLRYIQMLLIFWPRNANYVHRNILRAHRISNFTSQNFNK